MFYGIRIWWFTSSHAPSKERKEKKGKKEEHFDSQFSIWHPICIFQADLNSINKGSHEPQLGILRENTVIVVQRLWVPQVYYAKDSDMPYFLRKVTYEH